MSGFGWVAQFCPVRFARMAGGRAAGTPLPAALSVVAGEQDNRHDPGVCTFATNPRTSLVRRRSLLAALHVPDCPLPGGWCIGMGRRSP